jgi:DNA-binding FadR family transcriptional regulator
MKKFLAEHKLIVKAIASGDVVSAGQAMYDHVMLSKQRTIDNDLRQRAANNVTAKSSTQTKSGLTTTV